MMRHEAQNSPVSGLTFAPQGAPANRSELIFPSTTGRQLSNNTMRKLLMDLGIPAVPHGFRAASAAGAPTPASPARSPKPPLDTSSPVSKAPTVRGCTQATMPELRWVSLRDIRAGSTICHSTV